MSSLLQRRIAGFALVAFLIGLGLPFAGAGHLGLNDDTACGVETLVARSTMQVGMAVTPGPIQHCAICHLQRATSGASPAVPVDAPWLAVSTDAGPGNPTRPVASTSLDRQPARAPPTSLLS